MAVKAAIAGLGRIASLLEEDPLREKPCTHAGAVAANPRLVLCGGADTDEERRRLFAEKWKTPVYADVETMLREQRPRILHIATHPDSHWRYCSLAARCGVPVAVCEKPLADTLGAAGKIAALHRSGKITVVTNHERRYAADYHRARNILRGGRLGPLCGVRGSLYMGRTRRLLDVLWHDGTHLADAVMFLTGAALKHRRSSGAALGSSTGTAYLLGSLENPSVAAVSISLPFLLELGAGRDHLVFEIEFSCEQGRLRIGNGIFEVWESKKSPYAEKFKSLEKTEEGFNKKTGYFSGMVEDALSCVLNKEHIPLSSAGDGFRVIKYLHTIQAWR